MERVEIGMFARSKAGHDKGKLYIILRTEGEYVYLTDGHDDVNSGDSATDILDIEHHRHHEVVHRGQRVRSPAIVHAAAFGKSRVGEREAQRT